MTFKFSYTVEHDPLLDYHHISNIIGAFALAADETTDYDPRAWSLSLWGNEVSVSFPCECCRDRFIEIYEGDWVKPTEIAPAPSIKRARGRSRPACD